MKKILLLVASLFMSGIGANTAESLLSLMEDPEARVILKAISTRPLTDQEAAALVAQQKVQEAQHTEEYMRSAAEFAKYKAIESQNNLEQQIQERRKNQELHDYQLRQIGVQAGLNKERDRSSAEYNDRLARQRTGDLQKQEAQAHEAAMKREIEAAQKKEEARAKAEIAIEAERDKRRIENWRDPATKTIEESIKIHESKLRTEENVVGIKTKIESFTKAFFEFTDDTTRLLNTGKFLVLTAGGCAAGIYIFKNALPVIRKMIEEKIFTPELIEESSHGWFGSKKNKDVPTLKDLYFDSTFQHRVDEIITTLRNTKNAHGYYLNYLFYGLPGTGKTATARAIAYESGMDFAFMTGGSVLDLLRSGKGIQRLKEVFDWAQSSKRGLVLFIDEADAFLGDPNGSMSEELNAMLKAFLNYTGTESKNFCLILSTNHPNKLSKAVLSRVGYRQQVLFDLPTLEARIQMVRHFMNKYFLTSKILRNFPMNVAIDYIAQQTQGFAGRELSYLILGMEKAALTTNDLALTQNIIEYIVQDAVRNYNAAKDFTSYA